MSCCWPDDIGGADGAGYARVWLIGTLGGAESFKIRCTLTFVGNPFGGMTCSSRHSGH